MKFRRDICIFCALPCIHNAGRSAANGHGLLNGGDLQSKYCCKKSCWNEPMTPFAATRLGETTPNLYNVDTNPVNWSQLLAEAPPDPPSSSRLPPPSQRHRQTRKKVRRKKNVLWHVGNGENYCVLVPRLLCAVDVFQNPKTFSFLCSPSPVRFSAWRHVTT